MSQIVSVIIPVYKVEKYIQRCLESVIAQECDDFSIECIIVDDCSPDKSMVIAEKLIATYQGDDITFVIIRHNINKGISAARNTGIKAAKGDLIYFIDSDDHIMENCLKSMVSYSLCYPHVDVVMGNSLCMGINYLTNTKVTNNSSSTFLLDDKVSMWRLLLRRSFDHHAWNKLIRRSFILEHNLFFDEGVIYEDIPWTYRMMSCLSSVLLVPGLMYLYEYNPSSIIHTTQQKAEPMISSFIFICDYLQKNPPKDDSKNGLLIAHRIFLYHWMTILLEVQSRFCTRKDQNRRISQIKKNMLVDAIKHCRVLLALFLLTLFAPFTKLLKFRFYRSNMNRIEKAAYLLLNFVEKLH